MLTNGSYYIKTHFMELHSDEDTSPLLLTPCHGNYLAKDLIRPQCSVSIDTCMGFTACYIDGIFESVDFLQDLKPATLRF